MSERDGASPAPDANEPLGDLFANLPEPTQQHPTADYSGPAPGSRRAAREAARRGDASPETTPAALPDAVDPVGAPVPAVEPATSAVEPVTSAAEPVRPSAEEVRIAPARREPAPVAAPTAEAVQGEAPIGGGLDALFVAPDDDRALAKAPRKRRRGCLIALLVILVIVGGIAAAGAWAMNTYGEQINDIMGWGEPKDYEDGEASGEAFVTIKDGDTGRPVSTALYEAGVTKTEDVFYDYLIEENIAVTFYPGVYRLQKKMTAAAALEELGNEDNKLENTASVSEGGTIESSLAAMAESLGLPVEDFEAAVADPSVYGVDAPSLEGWLFPAVYTFDPEVTATQVIQRMVDRTREALTEAGVPDTDAERILTIASIIQREGRTADFAKVSRVIENRLDIDMKLQMDSTAQYGYGSLHEGVVSSSTEALEDDNDWNTYVRTGLPVTPIASPSFAAIDAAMHPEDGPWLYFVTIDLSTGETQFSETYEEHQAGIEKWREWCRANPDAGC
ncbi:endolytic transglycosylase MltG [Microbacterium sp. kSW2-24]|uniref:endolytic transglycosylase MltG n=1 Tax=Microbacterium galbinum TaxID=2851646 RepID=UPI001FFDEB21|nr:endolytic transglycosylase MltG [Microbacterium galbinum]MCK2021726.1 endolytic transglycosylase MltG [Microbacterium galbinum]